MKLVEFVKAMFDLYPDCNYITIDTCGITGFKKEPHIEAIEGTLVYISKDRNEFDESDNYEPEIIKDPILSFDKGIKVEFNGKPIFINHNGKYWIEDWDIPTLISRDGNYKIREKYTNNYLEKTNFYDTFKYI